SVTIGPTSQRNLSTIRSDHLPIRFLRCSINTDLFPRSLRPKPDHRPRGQTSPVERSKPQGENGLYIRNGCYRNGTVVHLHDLAGETQTDARTGSLCGVKRYKNMFDR